MKLPGGNVKVLLAKPMTYMNLSGEAVGALAAFYKIAPADILVISDDLDLPPGKLRLRAGGSAGGQKGVKSIIQHLHTESFPRLRVGIGRPGGQGSAAPPGMDPADYVLQNFTVAEEAEMAFVRPRAADAIETWLAEGIEAAMNQFNSDEGRSGRKTQGQRRIGRLSFVLGRSSFVVPQHETQRPARPRPVAAGIR